MSTEGTEGTEDTSSASAFMLFQLVKWSSKKATWLLVLKSPRCMIWLAVVLFLTVFHGFVDALEGNCRLFGCNKVIKFDLHKEICCDGTVYFRDLDENGNEKTKCCLGSNPTMYHVEEQECCGGEVISKESSSQGCCQGKVYNKNRHACCKGNIKNKNHFPCCGNDAVDPRSGVQCCGGEMYDKMTQTCCDGRLSDGVGECCGDIIMEAADDKCCRHNGASRLHISASGTRCCGLNTYRPAGQLCCNSVVRNKIRTTTHCCGTSTLDITTHVCCQGHVLPRESGKKSCCGGRLYDEDDEVCCRGQVYPGGGICTGRPATGRARCCDETPYQEEKEVCFNGLVLNKSLPEIAGIVRLKENSTTAYLVMNQFECGGELVTRSREKNACCSKTAYNTEDHLCCNASGSSHVLVEKSPTHDRCCGRMSYNSESHGCCNSSEVYHLKNEICNENGIDARYGNIVMAKPCLRNKLNKDKVCMIGGNNEIPYNSSTSVCTPKGVIALTEGLDICGSKTFNKDRFICCRGKIFATETDDGVQRCCPNPVGKETFIPAHQTCFNGRIENIPEKYARTCRGRIYDNRTHGCDVLGEIRSDEAIEEKPNVCWYNTTQYSYFNNMTNRCCNGHIISVDYTCCAEEPECCDPGAIEGYNRERQVCCAGVLVDKTPANECHGDHCSESQGGLLMCCQETLYDNVEGELTCDGNLLTGRLWNNTIICRGKLYENGTYCCGDRSYDNQTEICCGGVVAKRNASTTCCGNHFYDPMNSNSLCCESSFYENTSGFSCCGGVTYNNIIETCCKTGGKTYVFPSKDGLCCSNGEDYDDTLHTCCDGLVHKYVTNGTCCGNDVIRDTINEGCFSEKIYRLWE